jgi:NTE family protein
MSAKRQAKVAVVLSGGGARGAYEAGVIHYVRNEIATDLGFQPRFDILSGTSVGAINACFLAATADRPDRQGQGLADVWNSLRIEDVFALPPRQLIDASRWFLGRHDGRMSLLQTEPLESFVARNAPWTKIRRNLRDGYVDALTVTATHIKSGHPTVFVQQAPGHPPPILATPDTVLRPTRIGPRHALASAAIPLIFPAVALGGELFCDGGLRMNTPLGPALSLGADRVLVVGLRHETPADPPAAPASDEAVEASPAEARALAAEAAAYPSAPFLFGKVLDSLLLDQVEHDLQRLRRLNALLVEAREKFGNRFMRRLGELQSPYFGIPYKPVGEVYVKPSEDLGRIAADHVERAADQVGGLSGRLLRRLAAGDTGPMGEKDLASYLLFHGPYAHDLIALAREDCRRVHDALLAFFAAPAED